MKKLLAATFVAPLMVGLLASSLAQAEEHEWTNTQGKTIKAEFVSATNESVTISMGGKSYVVKLADLSPQSRALAAKLRVQKSKAREPATKVEAPKVVVDGYHLPSAMQTRLPKKRIAVLRLRGGKDITETAIIRGLNWLKANQAPDGSWGGSAKGSGGAKSPQDKNAMTGMALLAFLGHGELQDSPDYGPTVQRAIKYIASTPPDKPVGGGHIGSYSHPIRTYALCEAYTMTKIKRLEEYAKRAAIHVIKGQNENGGWAYGYAKGVAAHVDLSVTGWNIQALKAAALTGIPIDGLDEAMDKAVEYTKKCQDAAGKFAYKIGSGGKPSLTGTGVLCLQIWKNAKSQEAQKGLEWIIANQATKWKGVNVYEWYYHAQACFQAIGVNGGQKYWDAWNKNFQQIVCSAQESDGHWPPGAHFHGNTDVFRTTMTILMLQVYYRFTPGW